jgi:opacity protein-like surface antigen
MRNVLALVAVVALFAAPAFAGDGNVPQGTLSALGLGGMQVVSDAQGEQVRGRHFRGRYSWTGTVKGTSLIFGQLLTPDTKNFVVASSVNEVDAAEHSTSYRELGIIKSHGVSLDLRLNVGEFSGRIFGLGAGGGGSVFNYLPTQTQ